MIDEIIKKNIERYEALLSKVNRPGMDNLLGFIRKSDFYMAPASTRFHLSTRGGLLQHSLNVYDCLEAKSGNSTWKDVLEKAGEESIILSSLTHDLCKTYFYTEGTRNRKAYEPEKVSAAEKWQVKHDSMGDFIWESVPSYEVNDRYPLGHGQKSVIILQQYIRLLPHEIYAILWHMGYTVPKEEWQAVRDSFELCPFALALHEADLEASILMEAEDGNK